MHITDVGIYPQHMQAISNLKARSFYLKQKSEVYQVLDLTIFSPWNVVNCCLVTTIDFYQESQYFISQGLHN